MWGRDSIDHRNDHCSGIFPLCVIIFKFKQLSVLQDVFIIPTGAAGASAELERRKFTAEEGVCLVIPTLKEDDYDFVGSSHSVKW
jgi:hypothetical protein